MANSTLWYPYDAGEARGVAILVAAGCLSLVSVLALLIMMGVSVYRTKGSPDDHVFIRTHVAAYFVSLLLCDFTQGVGSMINIAWIRDMGVTDNNLCIAQGAIKQAGNVGTALWSLVIAIHTFLLLFYRARIPDWACYAALVTVWLILGFVLSLGPGVFATPEKGPFYGISGLWCWMTEEYPTERYTLEYLFMFSSAGFSFLLYSLVFFRLRGNIATNGWRISFQRRVVVKGYTNRQYNVVTDPSQNTHVMKVARQMMWYPVAYTILVVPIAAARFASFGGSPVPYQVTVFTATILMLSGFVNAILFTTTRRVIPARNIFPKFIRERFGISTGSGLTTHRRSFTNTNAATISTRRTKSVYPEVVGLGVSVNVEKAVEYDSESPATLKRASYLMSERPFRPLDAVAPFNNQQSLGSLTAAAGRKIVWDDQGKSASGRQRGPSVDSSSSSTSGAGPGERNSPNTPQHPNASNQVHHTNPFSPSTSPGIAVHLNPRDQRDRDIMQTTYTYGNDEYVAPRADYDGYSSHAI